MLTNKDIRVENGNLVLNGDKFPLDGQSPAAIMAIVEDNSDTTPTENSTKPVTSGGVFTALGNKQDTLTFDSAPTDASTNPVTSGGIFDALAGKLTIVEKKASTTGDSVTLDTTLTAETMYLVAMSAPTTATARRLRISIINVVGTSTNEEYMGSQHFTLTVTGGKLTITGSTLAYGIEATLIKL